MDVSASQALAHALDAAHLTLRDPPTAPTGYYDWEITTDPADDVEGHSKVTNIINHVDALKAKGGFQPKPSDVVSRTEYALFNHKVC